MSRSGEYDRQNAGFLGDKFGGFRFVVGDVVVFEAECYHPVELLSFACMSGEEMDASYVDQTGSAGADTFSYVVGEFSCLEEVVAPVDCVDQ